jgi:hypothetical protein
MPGRCALIPVQVDTGAGPGALLQRDVLSGFGRPRPVGAFPVGPRRRKAVVDVPVPHVLPGFAPAAGFEFGALAYFLGDLTVGGPLGKPPQFPHLRDVRPVVGQLLAIAAAAVNDRVAGGLVVHAGADFVPAAVECDDLGLGDGQQVAAALPRPGPVQRADDLSGVVLGGDRRAARGGDDDDGALVAVVAGGCTPRKCR